MFVYLSKLLPQFVYPLGLASLLLFFALFRIRRNPKAATWMLVFAFLLILMGGNRIASAALVRSLERQYLPAEKLPQVDAIVLLGGGTESPDSPRPITEINGAGDRVLYAAELYHQGLATRIILSGGNVNFSGMRGTTPAEEMREILLNLSVPEEALWLENKSQNTAENAEFTAELLRERYIKTIILVTSALHMPRSVELFEAQGINVVPAPTDYSITDRAWQELLSFRYAQIPFNIIPSSGALNQTTNALHEYFGMAVNRVLEWIE